MKGHCRLLKCCGLGTRGRCRIVYVRPLGCTTYLGGQVVGETHKHTHIPLTMERLCLRTITKVVCKLEERMIDTMAGRREALI